MKHSRRRVLQIVAGSGVALTTGAAAMVASPPQTLDGLRAWASYLDEVRMKEGWMLEAQAPAIVRTLARALKQCA